MHIVAHVVQVGAVGSHGLCFSVLGEGGREGREVAIVRVEFKLGVEGQVSVDLVVFTGTVAVPCELVVDVLGAGATLIAGPVVTLVAWRVALVGSGGPGEFVSLHNIELGAPVAINLVGIAVAISVSVHPDVALVILAWHRDHVEGSDAAALVVAEVDVPLDRTSEKVWLEVLGVGLVKIWGRGNVATAICRHLKVGGGAATLGEWRSDVEGLLLAVDLDLDLIKRVRDLLLQANQVL